MTLVAAHVPGGRHEAVGPSAALFAVGAPIAGVKGVADVSTDVDAARAARRAASEFDVPWSIQVRAEPDAEVVALAEELGRGTRSSHAFMVRESAAGTAVPLPAGLDLPQAVGYLTRVGGVAVGTALVLRPGPFADDCNVSTHPAHRRHGADLAGSGADGDRRNEDGPPHPSQSGLRVYQSLGFRTVERWTHFTP
ncbi:hypothetical protein [Streptomyces sp. S.PB5]|uniref:hypothetical protein n=1 Tax=Streptomyces sp. S.PB5 TaxID=3020844 RepID=UPI0025B18B96|nr:hypothetical protein [Streptomyces sp. S.PB5]MDN3028564.1 hypothetical protein [Streptomyces sp. S.PB5]